MAAKIRKDDLVKVAHGRSPDKEKLAECNARHAAEGLEPLKPGGKGKQRRVIKVLLVEGTILVESVDLRARHVRQGQNQTGGVGTVEAPVSLIKIALVDPDTKQRARVGLCEDVVERDGRIRKIRVHVTRGGVVHSIEQGKGV